MATNNLPSEDELIPRLLAEEVTQEAWMAVIRSLPKFERRSSLKTWILRIVSNSAKSRLRHESRNINVDFSDTSSMIDPGHFASDGHWQNPPHVWHADSPDAILASTELREHIDQALKQLPPLQQTALVLRDMQGMDMESICKILDVSESNGRVLIHRARSQLREAIDQFQGKAK